MWQTWNDFLASLAVSWAAGCDFAHGQPPLGDNPPYTIIGQNLYAVTGDGINLTAGVQSWYDEKTDYDYDTRHCADGKMCGHYTQVGLQHHSSSSSSSSSSLGTILVCNQPSRSTQPSIPPE